LKLEPRRSLPITLFISLVALEGVARRLSDRPSWEVVKFLDTRDRYLAS
jgi:hypothetical protein